MTKMRGKGRNIWKKRTQKTRKGRRKCKVGKKKVEEEKME
jgi:hypothetical protein